MLAERYRKLKDKTSNNSEVSLKLEQITIRFKETNKHNVRSILDIFNTLNLDYEILKEENKDIDMEFTK